MTRLSAPSPVMKEKWWERWWPWKCGDLVPRPSGLRHHTSGTAPQAAHHISSDTRPTVTKSSSTKPH